MEAFDAPACDGADAPQRPADPFAPVVQARGDNRHNDAADQRSDQQAQPQAPQEFVIHECSHGVAVRGNPGGGTGTIKTDGHRRFHREAMPIGHAGG
jgi:hypothetical protein